MMTKWDTIQADLSPVLPKYWDNEDEPQEISLDELMEQEQELEEMELDEDEF